MIPLLVFLLFAAETQALEVSIKVGMFGPLIPLFPFVEGSVTLGERGQNYQHEIGIRLVRLGVLEATVLELVNRSWFSRAAPESDSFKERFSIALEYSPYLALGRYRPVVRASDGSIAKDEHGNPILGDTEWYAGFAGLNLKGCASLLLGETPDDVYHELLFTDGIYIALVSFEERMHFTLAPIDDGLGYILYIPGWLSLGYGAGLRL